MYVKQLLHTPISVAAKGKKKVNKKGKNYPKLRTKKILRATGKMLSVKPCDIDQHALLYAEKMMATIWAELRWLASGQVPKSKHFYI